MVLLKALCSTLINLVWLEVIYLRLTKAYPKDRSKSSAHSLSALYKAQELLSKPNVTYKQLESIVGKKTRFRDPGRYRSMKRRKRNIHVNLHGLHLTSVPTNVMRCKIFCKSGFHLQIFPNGKVQGTTNQNSLYTFLELQSFGPSLIRVKGLFSGRYLMIDERGTLRGRRNPELEESLFKETQEENAYNSYASFKYFFENPYDMLLGIRSNGKLKKSWKTYPGQTATQFLVIKLG